LKTVFRQVFQFVLQKKTVFTEKAAFWLKLKRSQNFKLKAETKIKDKKIKNKLSKSKVIFGLTIFSKTNSQNNKKIAVEVLRI
jgi:hypothetical protein